MNYKLSKKTFPKQPSDKLFVAQESRQAAGQFLKHRVAHRMPVRVIHFLEPVQIDSDRCHFVPLIGRLR